MVSLVRFSLLLLLAVTVLGCGPKSVPVDVPQAAPADAVKRDLQMVADSGQLGSEMMSIQQNLEQLKATDPAKAEELLQDLQELEAMSGEAEVKAKAKEMLEKL